LGIKAFHQTLEILNARKPPPLLRAALVKILILHVLAFIVDLVGFRLPLSFSPGSCTRAEEHIVTLTINKDRP
jgi:hypothetical protein